LDWVGETDSSPESHARHAGASCKKVAKRYPITWRVHKGFSYARVGDHLPKTRLPFGLGANGVWTTTANDIPRQIVGRNAKKDTSHFPATKQLRKPISRLGVMSRKTNDSHRIRRTARVFPYLKSANTYMTCSHFPVKRKRYRLT
jgi:hypothetical protein